MLILSTQVLMWGRWGGADNSLLCKFCDSSILPCLRDRTTGNRWHTRLSNYQLKDSQVTNCWCHRTKGPHFSTHWPQQKGKKSCLGPKKSTIWGEHRTVRDQQGYNQWGDWHSSNSYWSPKFIIKITIMIIANTYWIVVYQKIQF